MTLRTCPPKTQHHQFCVVPQLENIPFLVHGFGTRCLTEKDIREKKEWKKFSLVALEQIHSDIIHQIDIPPADRLSGDALITDRPHILLSIRTADCLPVLIVSQNPKVIAAVHCGWRGTSKRLVQKVVETMSQECGCHPESLLVALGPSVEADCYEVGEDVEGCFQSQPDAPRFFSPHPGHPKKYFFDLKGMNKSQLLDAGVKDNHIHSVEGCTVCEGFFFSYRANKKETGRMINFIGIAR